MISVGGNVLSMHKPAEITTNNQSRLMLDANELTLKERQQFDYIDWDGVLDGPFGSFFRYRGEVYDWNDLTRCTGDLAELGWGGHVMWTYFSGVVVKIDTNDMDRVIVGTYYYA